MNVKEFLKSKDLQEVGDYSLTYEYVIELLTEYATLKAKETAKNVRHKACELLSEGIILHPQVYGLLHKGIMNIQFEDVKPEI